MNTAQDLINSRNTSQVLHYNKQPLLKDVKVVVTKLVAQQTALELMRKHHNLKGSKLSRNMKQHEIIRVVIKHIMGGGEFVVNGKFLHTPQAKLHI